MNRTTNGAGTFLVFSASRVLRIIIEHLLRIREVRKFQTTNDFSLVAEYYAYYGKNLS